MSLCWAEDDPEGLWARPRSREAVDGRPAEAGWGGGVADLADCREGLGVDASVGAASALLDPDGTPPLGDRVLEGPAMAADATSLARCRVCGLPATGAWEADVRRTSSATPLEVIHGLSSPKSTIKRKSWRLDGARAFGA